MRKLLSLLTVGLLSLSGAVSARAADTPVNVVAAPPVDTANVRPQIRSPRPPQLRTRVTGTSLIQQRHEIPPARIQGEDRPPGVEPLEVRFSP